MRLVEKTVKLVSGFRARFSRSEKPVLPSREVADMALWRAVDKVAQPKVSSASMLELNKALDQYFAVRGRQG